MPKFAFVVDRQQAYRRWLWLIIVFVLLAAAGSGMIAFRGVIPTALPVLDYLGCLFFGIAAVYAVGAMPMKLLHGEVEGGPRFFSVIAIAFPVGGFLGWAIMMRWFMRFLDGWQPPVRWVFASSLGFLGATIVLGFLLSVVLCALLARHLRDEKGAK